MANARRRFIGHMMTFSALGWLGCHSDQRAVYEVNKEKIGRLDAAMKRSVIDRSLFPDPLIIESCALLRFENNFVCRVRTTDGAEGLSVSNNMQMVSLYPIQTNRVNPFFVGKDARDLERLLAEVYVYRSNYKLQSLALWVPVATVEFAILDLLGKVAGKSITELLAGRIHHPEIGVYRANNHRGKSAEESIGLIEENVEKSGAKALKFKVGGRMSSPEAPAGRSEKLIPLIRDRFGPDMTVYVDANGSYGVEDAVRIGRLCEEQAFDFFEEPCPFDDYEATKMIADQLNIPIAGGEQEPSLRNFRWLLARDGLQVVQPDLFYFGGMIRSLRVARMAETLGLECVPHISGSGLGYLYVMLFAAAVPNAGPYHEFKGFSNGFEIECPTSDLQIRDGKFRVPTGPGMGVIIDPDFLGKHRLVEG